MKYENGGEIIAGVRCAALLEVSSNQYHAAEISQRLRKVLSKSLLAWPIPTVHVNPKESVSLEWRAFWGRVELELPWVYDTEPFVRVEVFMLQGQQASDAFEMEGELPGTSKYAKRTNLKRLVDWIMGEPNGTIPIDGLRVAGQ